MKNLGTAPRPLSVSVFPSPLALASGLVVLSLVLAGALWLAAGAPPAAPPEASLSVRPLPVYDATGAMLAALAAPADTQSQVPVPVYDATGAMWLAVPSIRP